MSTIRKYQKKAARFTIYLFLGVVLALGAKYSIDKSNIRNTVLKSIRAGVAPEALIVFVFTESESENLNWKKSHEFELNGEMYDIVESKKENGKITYTCFHDTKETKHKRRFYKLISNLLLPESDQNSDENKLSTNQKIHFCQPVPEIIIMSISEIDRQQSAYSQNAYHFLELGPNSPHPKV